MRDVQRPRGDGLVLVVHGDDAVRATIAEALALEGYRAAAADHWRALDWVDWSARAGGEAPGAILLDTYGPARAVAEALTRAHGRVPIVALTTRPGAEDGSALGAAAVLPLPFDLDDLLACVRQLCGRNGRGA